MKKTNNASSPPAYDQDEAYEQIYRKITLGEWPLGTKLPPEAQLAEQLGVSRPALRKSMMRLRLDGIIDTRQGAGSRVTSTPNRTVLDHLPGTNIPDLLKCYEFRIGLEGEAAYLAAQRASPSNIAAIKAAHRRMMQALSDHPETVGYDEDGAFHLAIAQATENSYYIDAISTAIRAIHIGVNIASTLPHWTRTERIQNTIREHDAILQAIRNRDGDLARQLIRQHITEARARVFLGQTMPQPKDDRP